MNPFVLKECIYLGYPVTILQPVAPWARSPCFDCPAQEVICRYIRAAKLTTVAGIEHATGYSTRECSRSIQGLLGRGYIQVVGRFGYFKVLAPVPRMGLDEAPLLCGGESLFGRGREPFGNSRFVLTNGIYVSEHAFMVMQTTLWMTMIFRHLRHLCVPYFETTLRKCFHWVGVGDKDTKLVYFRTTIPDVWLVFPGIGAVRLEVQLTRSNYGKLEAVVDDLSHDDQILYVVPSESMAKSIGRVEGRRSFDVIEFGNNEQLKAWIKEFLAWNQGKPGGVSPLVANYGSPYFRALMLKNAGAFAQPKPAAPPASPDTNGMQK